MIIRKMRLERGWSQEQLAQFSGLSVRTIQRLEKGKSAELESLKALAAVFEIQFSELQQGLKMATDTASLLSEKDVSEFVKARRKFRSHLGAYLFVIGLLYGLSLLPGTVEDIKGIRSAAGAVAFGWGIAVFFNFVAITKMRNNLFNEDWEINQIKQKNS